MNQQCVYLHKEELVIISLRDLLITRVNLCHFVVWALLITKLLIVCLQVLDGAQ
jgi:hypothetical protein